LSHREAYRQEIPWDPGGFRGRLAFTEGLQCNSALGGVALLKSGSMAAALHTKERYHG
jgi:hypothetical protein